MTGRLFDVTQSGMDADFGGRPLLLAGVPPNKEIAAFNLSRSAIRSESMWSVGINAIIEWFRQ